MKKIIQIFLIISVGLSFNSYALGGYESLSKVEKKLLKAIVKQLGITDKNNKIKKKIYDVSSYAFKGDWGSRWISLNEVASSKYTGKNEKGFIELAINSSENGTIFLTYFYRPKIKQIILIEKQVRYSSKEVILETFLKWKANTKKYELIHEDDTYGLLQKKGLASFIFFNVAKSIESGTVIYNHVYVIDI